MYEDIKLTLEYNAAKEAKNAYRERKDRLVAVSEAADKAAIWDKLSSRNRNDFSYIDFKKKGTDAYVVEGLTVLVDNCLSPILIREDYHQKLVRQLVTNFVNEEGSAKLLNKFKSTSYAMSEMAYIIETTIQSILEKAKQDESKSFKLDKEDKEKFYTKLEKVDVDVVWQCFLIDGDEVDARAVKILSKYNENGAVANAYAPSTGVNKNKSSEDLARDSKIKHLETVDDGLILLDHNQYEYDVLSDVDEEVKK